MLPADIGLDMYNDMSSYSDDVMRRNSWFSKNAYEDEAVLKSEYRELVKKYHPDVCCDEKANEIFIEIQSEHERILRSM